MKGDIVLDKLAEAWNEYLKECNEISSIPGNVDDSKDFMKAIHEAQRIILAKQVRELRPDKFR